MNKSINYNILFSHIVELRKSNDSLKTQKGIFRNKDLSESWARILVHIIYSNL